MRGGSTVFLKIVLILIGAIVTTALLAEPHFEGVNRNKDFFEVYLDPFIAYVYFAFVPFFGALFNAFKLLGHIERNKVFSEAAVRCLRNIKYCAMLFALFFAGIFPLIIGFAQDDDAPGVALIPFVVMFAAFVVATAAGLFQSLLQKAVDLKSENDLTV